MVVAEILNKLGTPNGEKSDLIDLPAFVTANPDVKYFVRALFDCDGYVALSKIKASDSIGLTTTSKNMAQKIALILEQYGITSKVRERNRIGNKSVINGKIVETKKMQYQLEIRGKNNFEKFQQQINFSYAEKALKLSKAIQKLGSSGSNKDLIPGLQPLLKEIKIKYIKGKQLEWAYVEGKRKPTRTMIQKWLEKIPQNTPEYKKLKIFSSPEVYWDEVIEVKEIQNTTMPFVYDYTLPETQAFVANGILVHNTASAERDSEGEGWILKAGAMVLASGGLAVIDEFDKMGEEDRAAIHGSMEQQFISIAKAGIVTQFQTRTSVLAAANPKFGRFDPTQSPAQQFNLSPALISRFDLIFPIRDVLDETRDKRMAEHILLGHRIASEKISVSKDSPIMPAIEMDKLRKYIAYARKTCFPILTDEAMDKIKEFYIELRKLGAKQNNYPITPRQIEGIIRLAEASAKSRLNPRVEAIDADRAIAMTNFVLNEVFIDKETGHIDSDVINIGQPKSKLDKTRSIISLISTL